MCFIRFLFDDDIMTIWVRAYLKCENVQPKRVTNLYLLAIFTPKCDSLFSFKILKNTSHLYKESVFLFFLKQLKPHIYCCKPLSSF